MRHYISSSAGISAAEISRGNLDLKQAYCFLSTLEITLSKRAEICWLSGSEAVSSERGLSDRARNLLVLLPVIVGLDFYQLEWLSWLCMEQSVSSTGQEYLQGHWKATFMAS